MADRDALKRAAAAAAVAMVADGMTIGLGSGTTAAFAVAALGRRVKEGLRVTGVPTSEATAALARAVGIPLAGLTQDRYLDLTIDGADQIARGSLDLVKGLGGALLREKLVARHSRRVIIVADESKLFDRLGAITPVPVAILSFARDLALAGLAALGAAVALRMDGARAYRTDDGLEIVDCRFTEIVDAGALDSRIKACAGVVETGFFLGIASQVMLGTAQGVVNLTRNRG